MDAYEHSVKLLALREHSREELRQKLIQKGYSREDIDSALERLIKLGYLSDERFASSFIRSRLRKNPEGRPILALRLKEKGCSRSVIDNALSESWNEEEYKEPLKKAYLKLLKKKDRNYAVQSLMKKGFSMREINEAEEELQQDTEIE